MLVDVKENRRVDIGLDSAKLITINFLREKYDLPVNTYIKTFNMIDQIWWCDPYTGEEDFYRDLNDTDKAILDVLEILE